MKSKIILLSLFVLLFNTAIMAESQEWGKISNEELAMEGIEEDPEADAVILFNKCKIQFTESFNLEMFYHKRIKILTEAGKEYANVQIYAHRDDKIFNIEAICYTQDGKKHELDDDNVFEEKDNNLMKKKFTIPGVEIGSVIEYKYQIFSKYIGGLQPWDFQEHDFTKYSEIMVYLPYGFGYSVLPINLTVDQFERKDEEVRDPYNFEKKCPRYTWMVKDMPGIKKEPHMTAFYDYVARILFQLVSYKSPQVHLTFAETWDDVAKDLWADYKGLIGQDGGTEDLTENLAAGLSDPVDQLEKIYDYVRLEIRTIGRNSIWGERITDPKKVLKTKEGSTNDKNILLLNMLKDAGIEAKPLLVSTRDNGLVNINWATAQQFDRIIAYVKLGDKILLLNCGEKYCPMGYLSPDYNMDIGFLVDEERGSIINLKPRSMKSRRDIETDATLTAEGQLEAKTHIEFEGTDGMAERHRIDGKDLDEYLKKQLEEIHTGAMLDSFNYADVDSIKKPLVLDIYFHIPEYTEDTGSLIFFTVPLFTAEKKNVFVREKRSFPVDFNFEQTISEKVNLKLADCFQLNELPEKSKANMSALFFNKIYFTGDNSIECNRSFKLNRTRFMPREYQKLRQIYEKMVNSDQDQIVITKKQ